MEAIKAAHIILGPLYFLIYVYFVFFVLLNMFLAIIGEAYSKVKENMAKRKNDFKFIGYIKYVRIFSSLALMLHHLLALFFSIN